MKKKQCFNANRIVNESLRNLYEKHFTILYLFIVFEISICEKQSNRSLITLPKQNPKNIFFRQKGPLGAWSHCVLIDGTHRRALPCYQSEETELLNILFPQVLTRYGSRKVNKNIINYNMFKLSNTNWSNQRYNNNSGILITRTCIWFEQTFEFGGFVPVLSFIGSCYRLTYFILCLWLLKA